MDGWTDGRIDGLILCACTCTLHLEPCDRRKTHTNNAHIHSPSPLRTRHLHICLLPKLSAAVGTALTPHLKELVTSVARRAFKAKFRDAVQDTLQELEANGGEGAGAIIKKKVPTYQSL